MSKIKAVTKLMKMQNNRLMLSHLAPLILLVFAVACGSNLPPDPLDSAANTLAIEPTEVALTTQIEDSQAYPAPEGYPEPEVAGAAADYPEPSPEIEPASLPERLTVKVIAEYPHNSQVFTQGLIWNDGFFYESGGLRGQSALYQVGLADGVPTKQMPIEASFFAEGIALVDDRIIMLTWQAQTAIVFDQNTFGEIGRFTYEGQGWGLCYDGANNQLWMSNGSNRLVSRNPDNFAVTSEIFVQDGNQDVFQINELECVDGIIYANIWKTDTIVGIDPTTGQVVQQIDASNLLTDEERGQLQVGRQVLNGIAHNNETGNFYLTGKEWPKLFEVKFVQAASN